MTNFNLSEEIIEEGSSGLFYPDGTLQESVILLEKVKKAVEELKEKGNKLKYNQGFPNDWISKSDFNSIINKVFGEKISLKEEKKQWQ